MDSGGKRYALGELGKLVEFQGGEVPEGTTALVEEHGGGLTQAGKDYCQKRRRPVHMETLRVMFAQTNLVGKDRCCRRFSKKSRCAATTG